MLSKIEECYKKSTQNNELSITEKHVRFDCDNVVYDNMEVKHYYFRRD